MFTFTFTFHSFIRLISRKVKHLSKSQGEGFPDSRLSPFFVWAARANFVIPWEFLHSALSVKASG